MSRTPLPGALSVVSWEGSDADWDALCDRASDLFQLSAVSRAADVFGTTVRRFEVRVDAVPVAAFAILEVGSRRAPAADRLFARRFHVQGGPIPLGKTLVETSASVGRPVALLEAALEELAGRRAATESDWKPTWPLAPDAEDPAEGWTHGAFGVAWRDLPDDPDAVLPSLSRSHRKAVRKALRGGVEIRPAATPSEVLDLVDTSFERSGLPAPNRAFLGALRNGLAETGRALELVAEGPQGPEAGLLAARVGDTVFNLFHGRVDDTTGGAANLLHLRLFEQAVRDGARRVHTGDAAITDDGSTGTAGILRFKRHLGFRVDPCVRAAKVHRPLARAFGRRALAAYRFLRGGDAS